MNSNRFDDDNRTESAGALRPQESVAGEPQPWEEIESGRYRPVRIRGSFRGRELG